MVVIDLMGLLLAKFEDVFITSTGLPPSRRFNHRIHLLLGTTLVAVRPYRYPQVVKDELERQCRDMLTQELLCFLGASAPSEETRRLMAFCVDYDVLNAKTVRDMHPIPVVDELLPAGRAAQCTVLHEVGSTQRLSSGPDA
jgi:hypothetical protein